MVSTYQAAPSQNGSMPGLDSCQSVEATDPEGQFQVGYILLDSLYLMSSKAMYETARTTGQQDSRTSTDYTFAERHTRVE